MDFLERIEKNWESLNKDDKEARANGQLVGRYIKEPCADSYAVYRIVKENKKTVKIQAVSGIGDDWQIPYWGSQAVISKAYAQDSIAYRDNIEALFSK